MLTNTERRDYGFMIDSIYTASTMKNELSLSKWCDRTRQTLQAVKVLKDDLQARYDADKARYSNAENDRRWKETQDEKKAFEHIARVRIDKDLDKVIEAKRAAFSKSMAAPDEASVRLLQTLQMRQNVTASEIAATVPHLSGNLQALSVLSEIASRNGVLFPKLETDFLTVESKLRESAKSLLDSVFSEEPTYFAHLFIKDSTHNGTLRPFVDQLDNPAYLQVDVSAIKDAKNPDADNGDNDNEPAV